jgi:hypothetical protein
MPAVAQSFTPCGVTYCVVGGGGAGVAWGPWMWPDAYTPGGGGGGGAPPGGGGGPRM